MELFWIRTLFPFSTSRICIEDTIFHHLSVLRQLSQFRQSSVSSSSNVAIISMGVENLDRNCERYLANIWAAKATLHDTGNGFGLHTFVDDYFQGRAEAIL